MDHLREAAQLAFASTAHAPETRSGRSSGTTEACASVQECCLAADRLPVEGMCRAGD
jgi:hypothetical protein